VNEGEWGGLECLYKACQASITDGGLFTDTGTGVHERDENDCEMKTVRLLGQGVREPTRVGVKKKS